MLTSNGYRLEERPERLDELRPVAPGQRGDRRALRRRLVEDGYLFLPGLLAPGPVHAFRDYYFDALAPSGLHPTSAVTEAVDQPTLRRILFSEVVPGPEYQAFCTRPEIASWFGWLLAGDVHLHRRKIIRHVRPGERGVGTATQAHYDLLYLREGSSEVLSMWIPLGDCPRERGGLVYLEGSHRWVELEEAERAAAGRSRRPAASITADLPGLAEQRDARWLFADYAAGDVVVHTSRIVHAALDNVDEVVRLSTDIRYQRSDTPIDARWQHHWRDDDGL